MSKKAKRNSGAVAAPQMTTVVSPETYDGLNTYLGGGFTLSGAKPVGKHTEGGHEWTELDNGTRVRPMTEAEGMDRQSFVDQTAIALFARGWPDKNVYTQAEKLWALRGAHLAAEATKAKAKSLVSAQQSPADDADSNNEVQ